MRFCLLPVTGSDLNFVFPREVCELLKLDILWFL